MYCSAYTSGLNGVEIPVTANDPNGNGLLIYFLSVPLNGDLYIANATRVKVALNVNYTLPDGNPTAYLYFQPTKQFQGTETFRYYVSDGCAQAAPSICNIKMNVNDAVPVALGGTVSTTENTPISITLAGTDDITPLPILRVILTIPSAAVGTLTHINGTILRAGC